MPGTSLEHSMYLLDPELSNIHELLSTFDIRHSDANEPQPCQPSQPSKTLTNLPLVCQSCLSLLPLSAPYSTPSFPASIVCCLLAASSQDWTRAVQSFQQSILNARKRGRRKGVKTHPTLLRSDTRLQQRAQSIADCTSKLSVCLFTSLGRRRIGASPPPKCRSLSHSAEAKARARQNP